MNSPYLNNVILVIRDIHEKQYIHRDISIRNIMFTRDAARNEVNALLIDFEYAVKTNRVGTDAIAARTVSMIVFCEANTGLTFQ